MPPTCFAIAARKSCVRRKRVRGRRQSVAGRVAGSSLLRSLCLFSRKPPATERHSVFLPLPTSPTYLLTHSLAPCTRTHLLTRPSLTELTFQHRVSVAGMWSVGFHRSWQNHRLRGRPRYSAPALELEQLLSWPSPVIASDTPRGRVDRATCCCCFEHAAAPRFRLAVLLSKLSPPTACLVQ